MESLSDSEKAIAWQRIEQIAAENITVYGEVFAVMYSVIGVNIEGLHGVIRISSVMARKLGKNLVGSRIPVKVTEVNQQLNRILLTDNQFSREAQIEKFQVGDLVSGIVLRVKPYGVIVDLGNVAALLRESMVSHHEFETPEKIFQEGDELKAIIAELHKECGFIVISTKDLEPKPGDMLKNRQSVYAQAETMAARYRQLVLGKVEPSK